MLTADVEAVCELDDETQNRHDVDGFGDGDGYGHVDGHGDGFGDGTDANGVGDGGFGEDVATYKAPWVSKGNNND